MATYELFCPVARALEKIGDKWSLLIVRDLLRGPQRFTDMKGYLGNITPKWLIQRLRELEEKGIVECDRQPGKRDAWYQLTPIGLNLAPVVEALAAWGGQHAMGPPKPGEMIHPDLLMNGFAGLFNRKEKRLSRKTRWFIRFPKAAYTVYFQEGKWSQQRGEEGNPDLIITTSPEAWGSLMNTPGKEHGPIVRRMNLLGKPARVGEFFKIWGVPENRGHDSASESTQ